ncbi:MAG: YhbY family RNA-binding protein [Erysipelotrichaceae bacterium]|nr:YhbY family RNA-binding protein [Erysipelotrichaceae bacterium]
MLTGKQKRYLRDLASREKALFQVGKDGLSENFFLTMRNALMARELVKISVLKTCPLELNEIKIEVAANTGSEIVQTIGRNIVFYKQSREKKIVLPK